MSRGTWERRRGGVTPFAYGAVTLYGDSFQSLPLDGLFVTPRPGRNRIERHPATPRRQRLRAITSPRFRLVRVRSPLLTESLVCFPFLEVLRWFTSLRWPPWSYAFTPWLTGHDPCRVSPFGHPRIKACLRLPGAFRSLPRPSSPLCAKASTVHP